jgi:hypothetical protein
MKLNTVTRDVQSSGTMEVSTAKIKATSKLFDMFADQTYANKPVAILRELVANGVDAHIAAGKPDVPVEVTMPNEFDPMFKVKDTGIGMHHDFVMGPFMEYTNGSTKDSDNKMIGGFGIGSKSPFAYCDQFTLRVVHDGVLSVYTMFKNEEGIPAIGLQGQTTTDEHNGVEVSFPVEQDDMEDFRKAAQDALQYFQPLPKVIGGELKAPEYTHISKSKKWAMKANPDGTLGVIMGGVRYPVSSDNLNFNLRNNPKLSPLLNYGLDLTLPIGACEVAMSREALSYTAATNAAIEQALQDIVDEVAKTFAHLFDKYKTKWDAQKALYDHLTTISGHGYSARNNPRAMMIRAHAKWKGQPLTIETDLRISRKWDTVNRVYVTEYPTGYPKGATVWVPAKPSWRTTFPGTKFISIEEINITPGMFELVVVDDMVIAGKSRTAARIEQLAIKENVTVTHGNVLVLRAEKNEDAASIKAMLDYLGNPSKIFYTSKLPEPPRKVRQVVAGGVTVARPKVRMMKVLDPIDRFGNTITNLLPAHSKRDSIKEIPAADQPTSGIVYVTEAWALPADFRKKMKTGLVKWEDIIFVVKSDYAAIKDQFKTFDSVFDPLFKKYKKKYQNSGELVWFKSQLNALRSDNPLDTIHHHVVHNNVQSKNQDLTKPFWKFVALCEKYGLPYTDEVKAAVEILDVKPKPIPNVDFAELRKEIVDAHPFLILLLKNMYYSYGQKKEVLPLLINNL